MKYRINQAGLLSGYEVQCKQKWKFWQKWETLSYHPTYEKAFFTLISYKKQYDS